MSGQQGRSQPADGVYYARDDYAGVWRRLLVDVVDIVLVLIMIILVSVALITSLPVGEGAAPHILFWSGVVIGFLYFAVLKRSSLRTPGYRLGRIRIVNLRGERPSLWAVTIRAMFAFLGPVNMLVDVLWLTGDRHRQALRDKFAHTYVVRAQAVPAGHGVVGYTIYTILGAGFLFAEVRAPKSDDP